MDELKLGNSEVSYMKKFLTCQLHFHKLSIFIRYNFIVNSFLEFLYNMFEMLPIPLRELSSRCTDNS